MYLLSQGGIRGYECSKDIDFSSGIEELMAFNIDGSLIMEVINGTYEYTTFTASSPYIIFDALTNFFMFTHYFKDDYSLWRWVAQLPRLGTSIMYLFYYQFSV